MCVHRTHSPVFSALWRVLCLETAPSERGSKNKIIVKKQNFKVAVRLCPYVRDRYLPAKHDICWAVGGFLSRKGTEESQCPGWLSAWIFNQYSCTFCLGLAVNCSQAPLWRRVMLLKPLLTIPCFTLRKALLRHLIFEHSTPQKFIFSLLHHLDRVVESDPIVSVSTALHEQCSLIGAKAGSSSDTPADEEPL